MLLPMAVSILWFRQDLRLADHAALQAALARGGALLPLFIDSAEEEGPWANGGAGRWWLKESLRSLAAELAARGSQLVVRRGPVLRVLQSLVRESGADAIFWTRRYEPPLAARDLALQQTLREAGLLAESRGGRLLAEPEQLRTQSGGPYQIFTPYWRAFLREIEPPLPLAAPARLPAPEHWPRSEPAQLGALDGLTGGALAPRRTRSPGAAGHLHRLCPGALPRWARSAGDRGHFAPLGAPAMGRAHAAPDLACSGCGGRGTRSGCRRVAQWQVSGRADLARILLSPAASLAHAARSADAPGLQCLPVARGRRAAACLAARTHRHSAAGCTIGCAWWWPRSWSRT